MPYRVVGLDPAPFAHLYGMGQADLAAHRARRVLVDESPGTPDRASLRDLEPGDVALLVHHVHQPADTPFQASHAIYLHEGATQARIVEGRLPLALRRRLLSLRAFDRDGMMIDADVVEGIHADELITRLLVDSRVDAIHAHFARPGCFAARIERS